MYVEGLTFRSGGLIPIESPRAQNTPVNSGGASGQSKPPGTCFLDCSGLVQGHDMGMLAVAVFLCKPAMPHHKDCRTFGVSPAYCRFNPYMSRNIFSRTPRFMATGLPPSSSMPSAPPSPERPSSFIRSSSSSSAIVFFFLGAAFTDVSWEAFPVLLFSFFSAGVSASKLIRNIALGETGHDTYQQTTSGVG